jgi:PAP2 superfamily
MVERQGAEPLGWEPGPESVSALSLATEESMSVATPTGGPATDRLERLLWSTPRRRLVVGWVVFAIAFVLYTVFLGLPYSEDEILLWLTAALFVASLGDLGQWRRGLVRDWLPLYVVLAVYALLRGYASHVLWGPFFRPQVAFDSFIGGGQPPTVTLQRWLFRANDLRPWDYLTWLTYMSHFFTSFIVAGVLWKRDHARFKRFVALFVGLTFLGYVTYVLYPALPPWLASESGHIAPITRIVPVVWDHVGIHGAGALFTGNDQFDNNIAAMPSLHAAYPMLLLLFFWKRARPALRALLVGYVLAMAFTLVYTGEHFVLDEVVGWSYAIVTFVVGGRLFDRWVEWRKTKKDQRQTAAEPTAAAGARPVPFEPIEADSAVG